MKTRTMLRRVLVATATGALTVSAAWAGTGLVPAGVEGTPTVEVPDPTSLIPVPPAPTAPPVVGGESGLAGPSPRATTATTTPPPSGMALVGAAKHSIEPRPDDYGGTWVTDYDACARMDESVVTELLTNTDGHVDHLANVGSPWPEHPDCIYMGGFGLGPANPVTSWNEELGLWVRAVAISDGQDTLILTVLDGEGYWWDYATKCADCGTKQLATELGAELDVAPSGIVIASTHSHAAPDFIGGWGFVPDWYMTQVTDTIRTTIRDAYAAMEPAVLEVGEERARPFNHERRDTYRAAEEQQVTWLRAYVPGEAPGGSDDTPGGDKAGTPDRTIATIGAYAAHPTTTGTNGGEAHPDWPGLFEKALEDRFGGVGLHFMTGLGNMSASGGTEMGTQLAQLIPDVGDGARLTDTDVRSTRRTWTQPATNVPLTTLGAAGFFDRRFNPEPTTLRTGEEPDTAPCVSSSPYSLEVAAGAARIGDQFALTTAPGEIFANFSNTLKERSGALVTMPLGQAMDALGYMPQDFEMNPVAQQGLGFFAAGVLIVNYEDSYAIDRCFGDMALETSIAMLDDLAAAE